MNKLGILIRRHKPWHTYLLLFVERDVHASSYACFYSGNKYLFLNFIFIVSSAGGNVYVL